MHLAKHQSARGNRWCCRLVRGPSYPRAGSLCLLRPGAIVRVIFVSRFAQHCRPVSRSTCFMLPSACGASPERRCGDRAGSALSPITWASAVSTTSRGALETLPARPRKLDRKPCTVASSILQRGYSDYQARCSNSAGSPIFISSQFQHAGIRHRERTRPRCRATTSGAQRRPITFYAERVMVTTLEAPST
jgi:hypothetical protein